MSHRLDTRGLSCPLPVLRAKKAIKAVPAGEELVVEATDPAAPRDFEAFCAATGNELLECSEAEGVIRIRIRRGG